MVILLPQIMDSNDQVTNTEQKVSRGRPTKYDPSFIDELYKYIDSITEQRRTTLALPTIEGFAQYLGIDADTIGNWATAREKDEYGNKTNKRLHPEFFYAIRRLKTLQKEILVNDGLYGGKKVNTAMTIFLLKANHGMVEANRTEPIAKNEKDLQKRQTIETPTTQTPTPLVA